MIVFGGTGYLGSALAARAGVVALGSRDADVRDEAAVDAVLARHRPRVVLNAAYRQEGPDAWSTNVDGAAVVARAAARAGARLIHMSTDVVFDGTKAPYREADPPAPVTDYGRSKAAAEGAVAEAHPGALLVRTSLLYGGAQPGRHERLAHDPDAVFFEDELRCPVHVDDLARALLELAELETAGILHVAGPEAVSRCELARLLTGREVRCGRAADLGVVRPLDCRLDSSRAYALLRTPIRGVREVLG